MAWRGYATRVGSAHRALAGDSRWREAGTARERMRPDAAVSLVAASLAAARS